MVHETHAHKNICGIGSSEETVIGDKTEAISRPGDLHLPTCGRENLDFVLVFDSIVPSKV